MKPFNSHISPIKSRCSFHKASSNFLSFLKTVLRITLVHWDTSHIRTYWSFSKVILAFLVSIKLIFINFFPMGKKRETERFRFFVGVSVRKGRVHVVCPSYQSSLSRILLSR